jgi:hypothetical protein
MANQTMILEVDQVIPSLGKAPGMIKGFENGEPRTVKAFADMLIQFEAGQTYEFSWYMGKPYQGQQDMLVSKHDPVKTIGSNSNSSQNPVEASQRAKQTFHEPDIGKAKNTAQGIMAGAMDRKDRSITVLAIMKSVIESGGDEEAFKRWLTVFDETMPKA